MIRQYSATSVQNLNVHQSGSGYDLLWESGDDSIDRDSATETCWLHMPENRKK